MARGSDGRRWAGGAVLAVVVISGGLIAGRAGFARLYRSRRPVVSTARVPAEAYDVGLYDLEAGSTLADVRSQMSAFGQLTVVPATAGRDASYACGQSPVGHTTGWRAQFDFANGRLVRSHFQVLDNPDLVRWHGWARDVELVRWAVGAVAFTAAVALAVTALVIRAYRRPVAGLAAGAAVVCCVAAALGDRPDRTFRTGRSLTAVAGPGAVLVTAVAIAARRPADRFGRGRCRRCGYDLTGNVSGTCPECGTGFQLRLADPSVAAALAGLTAADGDGPPGVSYGS